MKISFVLTIFNPTRIEMQNWVHYFNSLKKSIGNHFQFIFAIDNPIAPKYVFDLMEQNNIPFFFDGLNRKRTMLIWHMIDQNLITGDLIKICDPDDFLKINETRKIIKKLSKMNEVSFIKFKHSCTRSKNFEYNKWKIDKRINFVLNHSVNYNSIIVKDDIYKYKPRISLNIGDDCFWAIASLVEKREVINLNKKFYYWNFEAGESTPSKEKKVCDERFFMEHLNFIEELYFHFHNKKFEYPLNRWFLERATDFLVCTKWNKEKKNKMLKLYISKLRKVYQGNSDDLQEEIENSKKRLK